MAAHDGGAQGRYYCNDTLSYWQALKKKCGIQDKYMLILYRITNASEHWPFLAFILMRKNITTIKVLSTFTKENYKKASSLMFRAIYFIQVQPLLMPFHCKWTTITQNNLFYRLLDGINKQTKSSTYTERRHVHRHSFTNFLIILLNGIFLDNYSPFRQ